MISNKKINLFIVLLIAFSLSLTGCAKEGTNSDSDKDQVVTDNSGNTSENSSENGRKTSNENKVVYENGEFNVKLEDPVFVTSVGQSADVSMLDALMKKIGREYTLDPVANAEDMEDSKTILIAAGASSKGLGAAGISVEDETKRTEEIIDMVKDNDDIKVVLVHLGGQARRGTLSDQFTNLIFDISDYMIVVEDGNSDGIFTDYSSDNSIPISLVLNISDAVEPLKALLENE
ncbi:DUF6305 family protein [Paratissierella segnis]|jgi:hypothetical protein|uniref:DUF6305 domain-containing protein n=1 Tax=Paratissierella segnis TaxID=2763679 RepID=A0A926EYT5_9FIRM|nr:DUF6305 family protein [Paratissierella segnis]MBC8588997.1 hypothetical protein [Paratissierella segnis]